MQTYFADFHIHSVLSPCGDLAMSPGAIVDRALEVGLNLVAISDHNSALNAPALAAAAAQRGVNSLYGLEVRSVEEVDVVTVFDEVAAALDFGKWVYEALPNIECNAARFGDQVIVDANEDVLGFEPRLLISGIEYDLETICSEAAGRGGLVIPAHVDRSVDSVISQLGYLPDDLTLDAVEVSKYADEGKLFAANPSLAGQRVVRFSDAHLLPDVGYQRTRLELEAPTVAEIKLALQGIAGRRVEPIRHAQWERAIGPERAMSPERASSPQTDE